MGLELFELSIEVTRKCNLKCLHCMRGESQNIDITKEIIDEIFDNNNISAIHSISFSGGEPTLTPEIIVYIIDKIINKNINVYKIGFVTNGQIYSQEIINAFNRFNKYRNNKVIEELEKTIIDKQEFNEILKRNTDNHATILFSIDQFHKPIPSKVKEKYILSAEGINISEKAPLEEDEIYKTGFATFGIDFEYELRKLKYVKIENNWVVMNPIYITANGNITSKGDGQYTDMDKINLGNIMNKKLYDVLAENGIPVFNSPKIELNTNHKRKTLNKN